MRTDGPFGGETGLKIRIGALILFAVLAVVFLCLHDRRDLLYVSVYGILGIFETRRYVRRIRGKK